MKQSLPYARSSRRIHAAYLAKNRPAAVARPKHRENSAALGSASFGGVLIGLFLLLLL